MRTRTALLAVVFASLAVGIAWADPPVQWTYDLKQGQRLQFHVVGTYRSEGLTSQRIIPQGDSDDGGGISGPGGEGMSVSNGQPAIGTHDGGGQSSFQIEILVDAIAPDGKATCNVQFSKMTGQFDAPGMAGRTLPLCLFPQLQNRPFRVEFAPDGGIPALDEFDALVRETLGGDAAVRTLEIIHKEAGRALAACLPALPEMPGKPGASYKVGDLTLIVGPNKVYDAKKAVLVAGDGEKYERESSVGKNSYREKGGWWGRFYFGTHTRMNLRYEERHWREWSQKARTTLGKRTDMTEVITLSATLQKNEIPKPDPGQQPTGEDGVGQK